ncbi:hypothetical protein DXM27_05255 [Rhizobium rhizogenes]|uniref:Uncharacterized protein n=1 Tax=Rhizobium rhizogenes TaxID=359 RepID=A0AA88JRU9_RHIRH|nr:hypothetical protein [Rhizobium rhizogenes]KAA3504621.1 hypothetical protein DXM27_05255 [Rhizobium rhizogenes]
MNAPSARGLFRATGKKSKPVPVELLDGTYSKIDALEREPNEFYPTPIEPIRAVIHAELERLKDFPIIWGPACGTGVIGNELHAHGIGTYDSDLIDRGCGAQLKDFYDFKEAPAPAILENPPFAECGWGNGKARWLYHALDTLGVEYMGLLMNWGFPGAGGLAPFWAKYPPARVYLMRWKIDFTGQGAPPMLNGWFIWDKKHEGETLLRMLDRKDARQGELSI